MTSLTKLGDFLADLYIESHRRCENPGDPVAFFDDNIEDGMATSARVAHLKLFRQRIAEYLKGEEAVDYADYEQEWYDHLDRQHQTKDDDYVPLLYEDIDDDGSEYDCGWRD